MTHHVYFDSAATTKMHDSVIEKMVEVMRNNYGNASSTHSYGRSSKTLIETARKTVASILNAHPSEIIFTSGGTEADNLILRSAVKDQNVERIISSKIEHHAILHCLDCLEKEFNLEIVYLHVNENGDVDLDQLEKLLQNSDKRTLVSLMHVNNEIGNILDIERVCRICKDNSALFHSDSVQSIGHLPVDVKNLSVDFLTAAAHKFHGPKGVGFAFVRKGSGLKGCIVGGSQERGLRAGTESVHNIVGLEEAIKIAYGNLEEDRIEVLEIKRYFIDRLNEKFPNIHFNGRSAELENSTYTLINVCLPLSAEKSVLLQFQLDLKGVACSKGSACQSGSDKGSHVLSEILDDEKMKRPSIRFSFSKYNTKEDVDYAIEVLSEFLNH